MVRMIFDDTEKGAKPTAVIEADGTFADAVAGIVWLLQQFMSHISQSEKELFQAAVNHFIVEDHDE